MINFGHVIYFQKINLIISLKSILQIIQVSFLFKLNYYYIKALLEFLQTLTKVNIMVKQYRKLNDQERKDLV
jgi:hypothetical protein